MNSIHAIFTLLAPSPPAFSSLKKQHSRGLDLYIITQKKRRGNLKQTDCERDFPKVPEGYLERIKSLHITSMYILWCYLQHKHRHDFQRIWKFTLFTHYHLWQHVDLIFLVSRDVYSSMSTHREAKKTKKKEKVEE